MGKLLGCTLFVMFLLTLFMIFGGNDWIGVDEGFFYGTSLKIDGDETQLDFRDETLEFYIDPTQGAIVLFAIFIGIGIIASVNILGTGLSSYGAGIITKIAYYTAFWVIFSAFGLPLASAIPIFGSILYISLTIGYVWGAVQTL